MKKILLLTVSLVAYATVAFAGLWGSSGSTGSGAVYMADCSGITSGFCIDTDDGAIYYWNGSAVVASGGSGDYTLPTSSGSVLGGIKIGSGLSIDGNGVASTAVTATNALVGSCTGLPCLDGTSDGGDLIKLYGAGGYWTALQAGSSVANRSWRLPIAAAPAAGATQVLTMDEYGQMAFMGLPDVSGKVLSSTTAGVLSWATAGSGSVADTVYGASWNGNTTTAPSMNVLYDKIETIAAGALPTVTEGQILQGNSSGELTPVSVPFLTASDVYSLWTGTGYMKKDGSADAGPVFPYPGAGIPKSTGTAWDTSYTVTTDIINTTPTDHTSIASAKAVTDAIANVSVGAFAFDTYPSYSDSAHVTGLAVNGTTLAIYSSTAGKWLTTTLSDSLGATPSSFTLTVDIVDGNATDSVTVGGTARTTDGTWTGLSGATSFTVTPDTGRVGDCTGDGISGTAPNKSALMTESRSMTCTFASDLNLYTDSFEGADENPLASPWTTVTSTNDIKSVSGKALSTTSESVSYYSDTTGVDQYSKVTFGSGSSYTDAAGPIVRASSSAKTYYQLIRRNSSGKLAIYRVVSGTSTMLVEYTGFTATMGVGTTLELRASGTNPTTLSGLYNGSSIGTAYDDNSDIESGFTGMTINATYAATFSDWEGGDL